MYGALGRLLLKAAPHLAKHTAVLGGGTLAVSGIAGLGMQNLGGQGKLDDMYMDSLVLDKRTGTYKPKGIYSAFLKNFVQEENKPKQEGLNSLAQKAAIENLILDQYGSLTDFDGKYTGNTSLRRAQSLIKDKQKEDAKAERKLESDEAMRPYILQMQQQDKRAAEAQTLALQTRADAMQTQANSLAFQREQLAQQDRQYNTSLDRDERMAKERAYLAMMSGGMDALQSMFM